MEIGGDDGNLGDQLERDLAGVGQGIVVRLPIKAAQGGNTGADGVHGRRIPGQGAQYIDDASGEAAVDGEGFLERGEFGAVGQAILVEEVNDFLIGNFAGEFVDVVAGVGEFANVALDVGEARVSGHDAFQALVRFSWVRYACRHFQITFQFLRPVREAKRKI